MAVIVIRDPLLEIASEANVILARVRFRDQKVDVMHLLNQRTLGGIFELACQP